MYVADINWYRLECCDNICYIYCIIIFYVCDMCYYSTLVCVGWYLLCACCIAAIYIN